MEVTSYRSAFRTGLFLLATLAPAFTTMKPVPLRADVLAEFEIGKEGRYIVVPVQIGAAKYEFLLDTAATLSGFDKRLKPFLGNAMGPWQFQTPGGRTVLETYECPKASLGGLNLGAGNRAFCMDLTLFRNGSGVQIDGMIGLDFLQHYVVQIDFDNGKLKLLEPAGGNHDDWGKSVPMHVDPSAGASIRATLGGSVEESFVIDTGAQTNALAMPVFKSLASDGKLLVLSNQHRSMTANGEVAGRIGRIQSISVGDFAHEGLRLDECPTSAFGLRYLARYLVTLDFPNHTMYMKPSLHHRIKNHVATSGLALTRVDGKFVIHAVHEQGPAAKAGLKPEDIIVRIEGHEGSDLDMFAIGRLLTSQVGKTVAATVLRGTELLEVQLTLEARRPLAQAN